MEKRRSMSFSNLMDFKGEADYNCSFTNTTRRLSDGDLLQSHESFMIENDYYNRIVESLIQSFSLNHDVDVRFLASLINEARGLNISIEAINKRLLASNRQAISTMDYTYLNSIHQTHSRSYNPFHTPFTSSVSNSSQVHSNGASHIMSCNAAVILSSLYRSSSFSKLPAIHTCPKSENSRNAYDTPKETYEGDVRSSSSTPRTFRSHPRSQPECPSSERSSSKGSPRSTSPVEFGSPIGADAVCHDGEAFRARMFGAFNGNLDQFQRVLAGAVDCLPGGSPTHNVVGNQGGLQPLIMMLGSWKQQPQRRVTDGLVVLSYMAISEQLVERAAMLGAVPVLEDILAHSISPALLAQAACTLGRLAGKSPKVADSLCTGRTLPLLKALLRRSKNTQLHLSVVTLLSKLASTGCAQELARHSILTLVARTCLSTSRVADSPELLEAVILLLQSMLSAGGNRDAILSAYIPAYLAQILTAPLPSAVTIELLGLLKILTEQRVMRVALLCTNLPSCLVAMATKQGQKKVLRTASLSVLARLSRQSELFALTSKPSDAQQLSVFIRDCCSRRALPPALNVLTVMLKSREVHQHLTATPATFDCLCYILLACKYKSVAKAAESAVLELARDVEDFSWMCKERLYYASVLLGKLMGSQGDQVARVGKVTSPRCSLTIVR